MYTITFENLTAHELDAFSELLSSAKAAKLTGILDTMCLTDMDETLKSQVIAAYKREYYSFETIVKKMKVDHGQ